MGDRLLRSCPAMFITISNFDDNPFCWMNLLLKVKCSNF